MTQEIFEKIIDRLKEEFPDVFVEFTSNFALADSDTINNIFDSRLDRIICSLNSIDSDEYRKIMNLDYENTINNIKRLLQVKKERDSGLEVCLSIVETEDNGGEIEKFKGLFDSQTDIRVLKLGQWINEKKENFAIHDRGGVRHFVQNS